MNHILRNKGAGVLDYLAGAVVARRLSLVVPVLYMGLVLMGASIPAAENGVEVERPFLHFLLLPSLLQNLVHIPAYGLLAFLWRWSLNACMQAGTAVVLTLVLTISFGVFQEFYQTMIPGRYGSLGDVLSNALGAALGIWAFYWLQKRGQRLAG